jgi:hypothetical protein
MAAQQRNRAQECAGPSGRRMGGEAGSRHSARRPRAGGAALQAIDGPRKGGTEVARAEEEEREGGEGKGAVSPVGVGISPAAAGW